MTRKTKSLTTFFLSITMIFALSMSTFSAISDPALTVKIATTLETASDKETLLLDWNITANEDSLTLRGPSGLRLAFDNTVLQLMRFNGTGADYTLTETLASMGTTSYLRGVYEEAQITVRASQSGDGRIGYVTIELGDPEFTYDCIKDVEATLVSIRFAFRTGKTQSDLNSDSIRLMTIEELQACVQHAALNLSVADSPVTNTEYAYRSRSAEDTLIAPDIQILSLPSDNTEPTTPPPIVREPVTVNNENTYADMDKVPTWAKDAVAYAAERDLVLGLADNIFDPLKKVTRGEFTATLMRAYGIALDSTATDNFDDVDSTAVYAPYIATAKKYGIAAGVGNNKFAPEREITREEMFTLLYRTLVVIGEVPEKSANAKALSSFSDANDVASWARDSLEALLQAGMIDGTGTNKLSPKLLCDRATMAQMIYNLLTR